MFLPLSDMPNPRGTPVVNYLLIGINVAVYLLFTLPMSMTGPDLNDPALLEYIRAIPMYRNIPVSQIINHISAYDLFVFSNGFKPAHPSFIDLFSSMFLHAGLLHLFGNMLFLWIYGDNVEHRLGSRVYLPVYLTTGMMATLFYSLFQFNSSVPMIGASGAISGVLGLYFLWFPKNKVRVFLMLFPFFMDVVLLPARLVLGFYLIVDNLFPFLFASGGSGGVAHGAHIGGFLGGLVIAYGLDRFPNLATFSRWRARRTFRPEVSTQTKVNPGLSLSEQIHDSLEREDIPQAATAYFSALSAEKRKSVSAGDRLQLGFLLLKGGHYSESLTVFRQYIADHPNGPYLDRAYLGAGVTLYQGKGQLTSAYQYFLTVLDVNPDPETEAQARRYIAAIQDMQKMQIRKKG
jgi:membrane associated rhomboid family serine protease